MISTTILNSLCATLIKWQFWEPGCLMLENEGMSDMDSHPVGADPAHLSDSPFIHLLLFTQHKNKDVWCAMELKLELVYIFNKMNISAVFDSFRDFISDWSLYYPFFVSFDGEGQGSLIRYMQHNLCPLFQRQEEKAVAGKQMPVLCRKYGMAQRNQIRCLL